MVERAGVAGVTHRAVAAEAGLPTAAATYYFANLDQLLLAALHSANESYARALAELPDPGGPAALAELLARLCREQRARVVAEVELCLLAARRPALRPAITGWNEIISDYLARFTADPVRVRAAAATIDGLLSQALLAEVPPSAAELAEVLDRVLA